MSHVGEVIDPTTSVAKHRTLHLDERRPRQCEGWQLVWRKGRRSNGTSVIEAVTGAEKPETLSFNLEAPRETKPGDVFEVVPPSMNWQIHHHTITDCLRPVVLDGYGGATSVFADSTLTRDASTGVKQAIELRGRFQFVGNRLIGFDEAGCAALAVFPDPTDKSASSRVLRNLFERCAQVVRESRKGLWAAASVRGNEFVDCGTAPP